MGLSLTGLLGVVAASLAAEAAGGTTPHGDFEGELERALRSARTSRSFVIVCLAGPDAGEFAGDGAMHPGWLRSIHPRGEVILAAGEERRAAARFGAGSLPLLLVLDGEGREAGRIEGEPPADVAARRLRHILEAAERHREQEDPRDAEGLFWLGAYRWNRGDRFLAADCFRRVCELASGGAVLDGESRAAALERLGEHALDRGAYAEAEERFREARRWTRDAETARGAALGLSLSLRRQGRIEEAVAVLDEALAGEPSSTLDARALFASGYLRRELGDHPGARRLFEECAAGFPESLHGSRAARRLAEDESAPAVRERPDFIASED